MARAASVLLVGNTSVIPRNTTDVQSLSSLMDRDVSSLLECTSRSNLMARAASGLLGRILCIVSFCLILKKRHRYLFTAQILA